MVHYFYKSTDVYTALLRNKIYRKNTRTKVLYSYKIAKYCQMRLLTYTGLNSEYLATAPSRLDQVFGTRLCHSRSGALTLHVLSAGPHRQLPFSHSPLPQARELNCPLACMSHVTRDLEPALLICWFYSFFLIMHKVMSPSRS